MIKRILETVLIGIVLAIFVILDTHEKFDAIVELIYIMTLITENLISASISIARSVRKTKKEGENNE